MTIRNILLPLIGILLIAGCKNREVVMHVPSSSMEPTITAGSNIIIDEAAYDNTVPRRFDIVVFTPPDAPDSIYAFRIVGLPNEEVKLTDEGIRINDLLIKSEEGIKYRPFAKTKYAEVSLGKDEFYVLGDNVANARDSRDFGLIHKDSIKGKIIKIEQDVALDG